LTRCDVAVDLTKNSIARMIAEVDMHTDTTVPGEPDHPIVVVEPEPPDPVVSTPMTMQQPTELDVIPIDEEGYAPTSTDELGRATRLLFKDVPEEAVGWLWKHVKRLKERIDSEVKSTPKNEISLRNIVRRMIIEDSRMHHATAGVHDDIEPTYADLDAIERGDDDASMAVVALSDDDANMLRNIRDKATQDDETDAAAGDHTGKPEKRAPKASEKKKKKPANKALAKHFPWRTDDDLYISSGGEERGASLGDIAKSLGDIGASGVKNLMYRIEDKIAYFGSLDEVWFKEMMHEFAVAYVAELWEAAKENLDDEDIDFLEDLMDKPDTVLRLPEFRMWAHDALDKIYRDDLRRKRRSNEQQAST
jgi:hypothetical protein